MTKQIRLLLLPLVLVLFVACGGGGDEVSDDDSGAAQSVSISVEQHDIYYGASNDNAENPVVWSVPAGARVRVSLDNQGALEHNWAIVKLNETLPDDFANNPDESLLLYDTGLVDPGSSTSATFTAPSDPGSYTVVCTVAGHYPSMQGVLEVEG